MENLIKTELPVLAEEVCLLPVVVNKSKPSQNKNHELLKDILLLTTEIESKYPELYKHLDETPIEPISDSQKEITTLSLENYRETLRKQLNNHFETHEFNPNEINFVF